MLKHCKNKAAFTLVELSISIAIIGLLVSATLIGSAMIANTESKTLLSEVQKLNSSIGTFQALYRGMPGDIANATAYWGGTGNGDGSGKIDAETSDEPFRAVQQLYLAGLIDGAYAGFTGTWVGGFVRGSSAATGNVIGSLGRSKAVIYVKCCSGTDYFPSTRAISFNNHVNVSSILATNMEKRAGVLTPIEAYDIDRKVDDGVPDTGLVGGSGSYNGSAYVATGCYSSTGSGSTYDTAIAANKNVQGCQMQFAYDWN